MRTKTFWAVVTAFSAVVVVLLAIDQWRVYLGARSWLDKPIHHVRLELNEFIRHVKGPWNPFSKKRSVYGAPFDAVRWRDSVPEVRVKGTWYELLSLNDVPVEEIVSSAKKEFGRIWRKRFEEDLPIVLDDMGLREHFDSETGTGSLTVRRLDTGETIVLTNVLWTGENRMAILTKALQAWKANGRKDPRDDPMFP